MKIILLCFMLIANAIDRLESAIYIKGDAREKYDDLQKYLFKSKLLEALNRPYAQPYQKNIPRVKLLCSYSSPNQVLCEHNNYRYKITLKNGTNCDKDSVENIIRSVYENVEVKNRDLIHAFQPETNNLNIPHAHNREAVLKASGDESCCGVPGCIGTSGTKQTPNGIGQNKDTVVDAFALDESTTASCAFITLVPYASSPMVIVLPPESEQKTSTTPFPYIPCKLCVPPKTKWRPVDPANYLVIECDPNEFGPVMPCCPENQTLAQMQEYPNGTDKPKPQVYSCRWQGKRDARPKAVVFIVDPSDNRLKRAKVLHPIVESLVHVSYRPQPKKRSLAYEKMFHPNHERY